jgi:hypothetical protein
MNKRITVLERRLGEIEAMDKLMSMLMAVISALISCGFTVFLIRLNIINLT